MKRKTESSATQSIDRRLILRLRIYLFVMLVLLVVIVFEVLRGVFDILLVIGGLLIGLVIGVIVSRMYSLSWDEETNKVIGNIDGIGAVILVCYLIFIFTKTSFFGNWVQGAPLFSIILGITTGTMLGRVLGTKRGINKLIKALEI